MAGTAGLLEAGAGAGAAGVEAAAGGAGVDGTAAGFAGAAFGWHVLDRLYTSILT